MMGSAAENFSGTVHSGSCRGPGRGAVLVPRTGPARFPDTRRSAWFLQSHSPGLPHHAAGSVQDRYSDPKAGFRPGGAGVLQHYPLLPHAPASSVLRACGGLRFPHSWSISALLYP
jgi:hypothetical protein